jgi:REP element-mobilizing transposase RayT
MARRLRQDGDGLIHHVTARGVERRLIFGDAGDCCAFIARLAQLLAELGFVCLAWALIPNHFHLLVKRKGASISKLMARLNGPYAQAFNRRNARVGHLFQDRFVSRVIESDADLVNVVRYVLFNPVRHGVVRARELRGYPWCSFGALVGARAPYPFEAIAETLRLFAPDPIAARLVLEEELSRIAAERRASDPVEVIVRNVLASSAVPRGRLGSRGAEATALRDRVCAEAVRLGIPRAEIARALGISRTAVHQSLARSSRLANNGV